jgi:hypothetical protein
LPQLRRELASALRDITNLLGLGPMLHYMLQLLGSHFSQLGPGAPNGATAAAGKGANGAGADAGAAPPWVALESALYAANVVVGRRAPEIDPGSVLQLLQVGGRREVAIRRMEGAWTAHAAQRRLAAAARLCKPTCRAAQIPQ